MSKLVFKLEDFITKAQEEMFNAVKLPNTILVRSWIEDANRIFNKWLSEQQVVYMHKNQDNGLFQAYEQPGTNDTHKAHLVCIEEIAPVKCEHEPRLIAENGSKNILRWYCSRPGCGKVLKPATWTEV